MELQLNEKEPKSEKFKEPILIKKTNSEINEREIYSNNKLFKIDIYNPAENDKKFKFLYSKEAKYYLISEKEANFQIRMYDLRENSTLKAFASVLYIDGKEIQRIKTSIKRGTYFGFKKGGGEYEYFVFAEPEISKQYSFDSSTKIENSDYKSEIESSQLNMIENFGTIKIIFYDTKQEHVSKLNTIFKDFRNYNPNKRELDKKFCIRNQTVKKGRGFKRDITFKPEISIEDEMKFILNMTDFEKKIDEVIIYYQDFISMNIMGLISMSNINHVKYIPNDPEYVHFAIRILKTILFDKNKDDPEMKIYDLLERFKELTNIDFNFFLANEKLNFEDYITKIYFREFQINNGFLAYRNLFDEISRIESLKIPKHQGKNKYITRPIENIGLHNSINLSNIYKNNSSNLFEKKITNNEENYNYNFEDNFFRIYNSITRNKEKKNDNMKFEVNNKLFDMTMNSQNNKESFEEIENINDNHNFDNTMMDMDEEPNHTKELITISLLEDDD